MGFARDWNCKPRAKLSGLATPIWTVFSEIETRIPELSRTHVAWLRVQPEMVVPVDVVVQPGLQPCSAGKLSL